MLFFQDSQMNAVLWYEVLKVMPEKIFILCCIQ